MSEWVREDTKKQVFLGVEQLMSGYHPPPHTSMTSSSYFFHKFLPMIIFYLFNGSGVLPPAPLCGSVSDKQLLCMCLCPEIPERVDTKNWEIWIFYFFARQKTFHFSGFTGVTSSSPRRDRSTKKRNSFTNKEAHKRTTQKVFLAPKLHQTKSKRSFGAKILDSRHFRTGGPQSRS